MYHGRLELQKLKRVGIIFENMKVLRKAKDSIIFAFYLLKQIKTFLKYY